MDARRLGVYVMAPHVLDKFSYLLKHMLTELTRWAHDSSMLLLLQKTWWYLAPTSPMPLLRHHLLSNYSLSALIALFAIGGFNTSNWIQLQMATWFQSYQPCRATPSPPIFRRNTPTRSYVLKLWTCSWTSLMKSSPSPSKGKDILTCTMVSTCTNHAITSSLMWRPSLKKYLNITSQCGWKHRTQLQTGLHLCHPMLRG